MIDSRKTGLEGCESDYSIVDNVSSVFLSIVGTEDIWTNLEPRRQACDGDLDADDVQCNEEYL